MKNKILLMIFFVLILVSSVFAINENYVVSDLVQNDARFELTISIFDQLLFNIFAPSSVIAGGNFLIGVDEKATKACSDAGLIVSVIKPDKGVGSSKVVVRRGVSAGETVAQTFRYYTQSTDPIGLWTIKDSLYCYTTRERIDTGGTTINFEIRGTVTCETKSVSGKYCVSEKLLYQNFQSQSGLNCLTDARLIQECGTDYYCRDLASGSACIYASNNVCSNGAPNPNNPKQICQNGKFVDCPGTTVYKNGACQEISITPPTIPPFFETYKWWLIGLAGAFVLIFTGIGKKLLSLVGVRIK